MNLEKGKSNGLSAFPGHVPWGAVLSFLFALGSRCKQLLLERTKGWTFFSQTTWRWDDSSQREGHQKRLSFQLLYRSHPSIARTQFIQIFVPQEHMGSFWARNHSRHRMWLLQDRKLPCSLRACCLEGKAGRIQRNSQYQGESEEMVWESVAHTDDEQFSKPAGHLITSPFCFT